MKITFDIPDTLTQDHPLTQADWLREIAVALFQQELITLGTASHIAGMHQMQFQELLYAEASICITTSPTTKPILPASAKITGDDRHQRYLTYAEKLESG